MKGIEFFIMFAFALSGCQIEVSGTDLTASHLHRVSRVIARLTFEDCGQATSLSDVLAIAQKKGIISADTKRGLELGDFWGRPYHFKCVMNPNIVTINLVSNGPNGVFEDGKGDDVRAEIVVPKSGKASGGITFNNRKTLIP